MTGSYKVLFFRCCFTAVCLLMVVSVAYLAINRAQSASNEIETTYPHFASLRFNKVNLRSGPGLDHPILRTYHKKGLPVEILGLSLNWHKVRDYQGKVGWMRANQTRGERFAVLKPWGHGEKLALRAEPETEGRVRVWLASPSLVSVSQCNGVWCEVSAEGFTGWVKQVDLWGIYAGEVFEA